jgi:hypothetical protein
MMRDRYYVEGDCVMDASDGLMVYDQLSAEDSLLICRILNRGLGPEWDAIEYAVEVERARRARRARKNPDRTTDGAG